MFFTLQALHSRFPLKSDDQNNRNFTAPGLQAIMTYSIGQPRPSCAKFLYENVVHRTFRITYKLRANSNVTGLKTAPQKICYVIKCALFTGRPYTEREGVCMCVV